MKVSVAFKIPLEGHLQTKNTWAGSSVTSTTGASSPDKSDKALNKPEKHSLT